MVHFPKRTCAACPLRERCTTSRNGRSVSIHPDEALLAELRQRQQTPAGRAALRERVQVEHALGPRPLTGALANRAVTKVRQRVTRQALGQRGTTRDPRGRTGAGCCAPGND